MSLTLPIRPKSATLTMVACFATIVAIDRNAHRPSRISGEIHPIRRRPSSSCTAPSPTPQAGTTSPVASSATVTP